MVSTLQVEIQELKFGASSKVATTAENQVANLEASVDRLKATLRDSEPHCKDLEQAADNTHGELKHLQNTRCHLDDEVLKLAQNVEALRPELQSMGAKVIADYKESRGFQLGLERTG
ncbi:hypothetical protein B296_00019752 [Ensete ventricosum]|uniref:Uncharacterized protein n=1 Tax=Ensete ventricosum TaxID=4639 RepID=A0A426ZN62_ENSVE|nr:hypothetical protein B296_00019752 [Ensete ventricosum]